MSETLCRWVSAWEQSVPLPQAAITLMSFAKKIFPARKLLSCTPESMLFISGTPLPCAAGLMRMAAMDTAARAIIYMSHNPYCVQYVLPYATICSCTVEWRRWRYVHINRHMDCKKKTKNGMCAHVQRLRYHIAQCMPLPRRPHMIASITMNNQTKRWLLLNNISASSKRPVSLSHWLGFLLISHT